MVKQIFGARLYFFTATLIVISVVFSDSSALFAKIAIFLLLF